MYISMIHAPKASSKGRSISFESPPHTYKNPSQNFFQEGLMCSGRESNPYGHFCPRDFLATLAFTQAGFIHNAKPL